MLLAKYTKELKLFSCRQSVLIFKDSVKKQTGVLLVVRFIGDFSEMPKSEVGDLDHPATVQQTVGALETTVKLQRTLVNILHSLRTNPRRKRIEYTDLYKYDRNVRDYFARGGGGK